MIFALDECREIARNNFITVSGKLKPVLSRDFFVEQHRDVFASIEHHTSEVGVSYMPERIYVLLFGRPECKHCGNHTAFINFHKGYRPFCSSRCNGLSNTPSKFLDDEAKQRRSENMSLALRGRTHSDEAKKKMSNAAKRADVQVKKAKTNKDRYGVENPGVLGAYSSRAATNFIFSFINYFGIEKERCLFKTETQHEFFQNIAVSWSSKKRYVSYDLVVFNTPAACFSHRAEDIDMVLEYQGPWHYSLEEIAGHEDEPATPYPRSLSKTQTLEIDIAKRERIREIAPAAVYLTHWWKTNRTHRML